MKIACSTLACPGWTIGEAVDQAAELGFSALDMRAFEDSDACFACNPMDHDAAEVERLFDKEGIEALCVSSGVTLDAPVFPPVIGRVFDEDDAGVAETKRFVDFAERAGAHFVRVFPGQHQNPEPRAWGDRRIGSRLRLAGQTARNTSVRVLVENQGAYARASDLKRLLDGYGSEWVRAVYNPVAGRDAGDDPVEAVRLLGGHLAAVRVMDHDDERVPTLLGEGIVENKDVIETLVERGVDAWAIYEYPKFWLASDTRDPKDVLEHAAKTLYAWSAAEPAAV